MREIPLLLEGFKSHRESWKDWQREQSSQRKESWKKNKKTLIETSSLCKKIIKAERLFCFFPFFSLIQVLNLSSNFVTKTIFSISILYREMLSKFINSLSSFKTSKKKSLKVKNVFLFHQDYPRNQRSYNS